MPFYPEKVFFKSDTHDPFTSLPVYVFDSNYLPNLTDASLDKKEIDEIIVKCFNKIIPRIPRHPYALTCFSSGFKNVTAQSNSWLTMLKCYQLLPQNLRDNLKKIYMVHESWLLRSVAQVFGNVLQIKIFKTNSIDGSTYDKLIYCKNLTELSKLLDITKIRISLDAYLYDFQQCEKLIIPYTVKHDSKDFKDYKQLIFDKATQRLTTEGLSKKLILTKPGRQNKLTILFDAIDRMNYLDLSQWDVYSMGSLYLHLLKTYHVILIPIDQITLPIHDDYDYTLEIFNTIIENNDSFEILARVLDLSLILISSEKTEQDLKSISKALLPALSQEKISLKNNDRLVIGQRFLKNLLENWERIQSDMFPALKPSKNPKAPASRKVSTSKDPVLTLRTDNRPRTLPPIPKKRSDSISSSSSIDLSNISNSSVNSFSSASSPKIKIRADNLADVELPEFDELKALSDVTSSLNKQNKPIIKPLQPVVTRFSDGYSSIEGKKKVNKLAKLYEEGLKLKGVEFSEDLEQEIDDGR